jgi:uncharacterized membrane protein
MAERPAASERIPPEYLNVLTHFYRGEVARATEWRRRLDLTTNWAIIATTAAFSWAFSAPMSQPAHLVFVFASHLVFLLMCIEARRYRHYDLWHTRVRMLEVHLLVPALNPELKLLEGDWREVLSNDLLLPSFKISFLEALARRLHANYIWLYLGLVGGWGLRVYSETHERVARPTFGDLVAACGYPIGPNPAVPPVLVIGAQLAFWGILLVVYVVTWRTRHVTGEIRRRDPKAKKWPI